MGYHFTAFHRAQRLHAGKAYLLRNGAEQWDLAKACNSKIGNGHRHFAVVALSEARRPRPSGKASPRWETVLRKAAPAFCGPSAQRHRRISGINLQTLRRIAISSRDFFFHFAPGTACSSAWQCPKKPCQPERVMSSFSLISSKTICDHGPRPGSSPFFALDANQFGDFVAGDFCVAGSIFPVGLRRARWRCSLRKWVRILSVTCSRVNVKISCRTGKNMCAISPTAP